MPSTVDVATGANELTYVGTKNFDSVADRKFPGDCFGPGAYDFDDFDVSYAGTGLNLQVNAGVAYVRGTNTEQGLYRVRQPTNVTTLSISSNSSGNPRIDRVILRIYDNDSEAAGAYKASVEVVTGSPNSGATLDNLTGAVDLSTLGAPKTCLLLADVLVPSGASSILNTNIRDRRCYSRKTIPALDYITFDAVPLEFAATAGRVSNRDYDGSVYANRQAAGLVWCPRRLLGVTKVRWRYAVTTTIPAVTNWNMAILDASGRLITKTGNVAFDSSAATSENAVNQAWQNSFDTEIGWYYLWFSVGNFSSGGHVRYTGLITDSSVSNGNAADASVLQNNAFRFTSGGPNFGSGSDLNTLRYMTDIYNITGGTGIGVPQVALSVG